VTDVRSNAERVALYRFFNSDDELLYAGISADPAFRWKEHRRSKPWAGEVTMRVIEWFPTREEALRAESDVILCERPRYNVSQSRRPDKPGPPRPSMRRLRRADVASAKGYMAIQDVAALLGVTPRAVSTYRYHSKPGRVYAGDPFPAQDGVIAHHPVWSVGRKAEIRQWRARHQPRKHATSP